MSPITDDLGPLDEQAFGVRVEPYRRELHVHCYRLPGSFEEAEGLVRTRRRSARRRVARAELTESSGGPLLDAADAWRVDRPKHGRAGLDRWRVRIGVFGSMRCVLTLANRQPAVAGYVRKPGDAAYVPPAIDVLRVQDGVVTEIVTFDGAVFGHFDLPATISAEGGAR